MWDGFWREGLGGEDCDHTYHNYNIDHVELPTYKGLRSSSHDASCRMWNHKNRVADIAWAGKSACHSPRFHGHTLMPVTMLTLQRERERKAEKEFLRLQYHRACRAQPDLTSDIHKKIGGDID